MAITKSGYEQRAAPSEGQDVSDGAAANGALPGGMPGLPGDKSTGAGQGKRKLKKYAGQVAGAPPVLTTGGGALGHTGGDIKK